MDYSIEEIYLMSGQFDRVATVSFKISSESRILYGDYITGEFVYTPQERETLQQLVGASEFQRNDGFVRFNVSSSSFDQDKNAILKKVGFMASDVMNILQLNGQRVNRFSDATIRTLPKPIELKMNLGAVDNDLLTINVYSQFLADGDPLIPDEWDQYHAAILGKYGSLILTEKFRDLVVDSETGEIKKGIKYHHLKNRYLSKQGLTEDENKEFNTLLNERSKERSSIAIAELKRSTQDFKKLVTSNPKILTVAVSLATYFQEARLTYGKFPVWWDFERFVHIYFRHVRETQIGERFLEKSFFQYSMKDIKKLVSIVLDLVQDEIEQHFLKNSDKEFRRQGSMSVYYNGDYYSFHIAPDGRLLTFYKSSKNNRKPSGTSQLCK